MILVVEITGTGAAHVVMNRALTLSAALAFPHQRVRLHAEPEHLAAVRDHPAVASLTNLDFAPITLSPLHRWKMHVLSRRRFAQEWRTLRACLRAAPEDEPILLLLTSATPTAILAARLLAGASRGRVSLQVGLHGELNNVVGWRSRNPIARALDLRSMLAARDRRMRLLVFEEPIRDGLEAVLPGSAARTDVMPHPVDGQESAGHRPAPVEGPIRIGLVGLATEAKGISLFLETARRFRERHGDRIEFLVVGGRPDTTPSERFADIAHEVTPGHVPRAVFAARMAALHHVFLPLDPRYYSLSASGGLLDAVAWRKPIIASRVPITESLFRQAGDIGDLCDGPEAMQAALERIVTRRDADRYARQVAALDRVRATRLPEAQAQLYRGIVERGFPRFAAGPQAEGAPLAARAGGGATA